MEQQLPAVLNGEKSGPVEQLQLAALCQRYLKRYADAAQLYAAALATLPPTAKELRYPKRYNAACAATLAAAGKGKAADKQARAKLRQQAFEWLQAETSAHAKLLDGTPQSAAVIQDRLQHWQQNPDLNSICADEELKKLPEPERHKWHKLWSEVATLQKQARDSYDEKKITGQLTPAKTTHNHKLQLSTTKVYVIEMHSKQFNTLLRLEDAGGKSLAENDDISKQKGILDSRITFAPTKTGTYHLIADSFQPRGCGNYEIIIREFSASGKTTTVETPTKQNKGNKPPALTRPRQAAK